MYLKVLIFIALFLCFDCIKNADLNNEDLVQLEKVKPQHYNSSAKLIAQIKNYLTQKKDKKLAWHAVTLLGQSKQNEALDILCQLLLDNDEPLSNLTINALIQIADQKSVPCIIEYAHRKPAHIRLKAILAVEKLGGKEAAAWLFTLSTGHNDRKVRNAAKKALRSVESKMLIK
jgi:HEAT repeat protein